MITDNTIVVVGKIKFLHSSGTTIKGYSLEFNKDDGFFEPIIDEQIMELLGNDSILYVHSFDLKDTNYYLVEHKKGLIVTKVSEIKKNKFDSSKSLNFLYKYKFN